MSIVDAVQEIVSSASSRSFSEQLKAFRDFKAKLELVGLSKPERYEIPLINRLGRPPIAPNQCKANYK